HTLVSRVQALVGRHRERRVLRPDVRGRTHRIRCHHLPKLGSVTWSGGQRSSSNESGAHGEEAQQQRVQRMCQQRTYGKCSQSSEQELWTPPYGDRAPLRTEESSNAGVGMKGGAEGPRKDTFIFNAHLNT
ncbi:hypothetical protein GOODEAATRI_008342, partial [Goodea atripinnis]